MNESTEGEKTHKSRSISSTNFWKVCAVITMFFWIMFIVISLLGSYFPPPESGKGTLSFLLESLKFVTYTLTGFTFSHTFREHFLKRKRK